jgi:hypothetical protein
MNQTKHCWQNYVDYHKCILAKGEDFAPCRQFWLAYRSLCPSGWYQRWDEQRGMTSPAPVIARAHADNFSRGWKLPCALGVREMETWRNAQYDRQGHSLEMAAAAVLLDDVHRAEIAYIPTLTMLTLHL